MCPIFEEFDGNFILTNGAHKIAKLCSRHRSISMGIKLSARGENVSLLMCQSLNMKEEFEDHLNTVVSISLVSGAKASASPPIVVS